MKFQLSLIVIIVCSSLGMGQIIGIGGQVRGADRLPIPGAVVTFLPLPTAKPSLAVVSSAVSDAKGAYALTLRLGDYVACVSVPRQTFLDPCKWSTPAYVKARSAAQTLDIELQRGTLLRVVVADPERLLFTQAPSGPMDFPRLICGVRFGTGAFLAATRTTNEANYGEYTMLVPVGVSLNLWLSSNRVKVANVAGSNIPVSDGAKIPFRAVQGNEQIFVFTVTGRS